MDPGVTKRFSASKLRLLADAAGGPRELGGKLARFARILATYADARALDDRLARLHARGVIEAIPTRVQLAVGALDMLRFWIAPAAVEYYADKGIHFGFHQVLRFLDEPASLADPIGLCSTRDGIIGHLMQVVHGNPAYDLELLAMFDDGVEELERQIEAMIAGTHPRAASIGAIVEEPDYHARLLAFVRAYRADPKARPPLRSNVAARPAWDDVERTFGTLGAAMRYFRRLPATPAGALAHWLRVRSFPRHLAEPER